MLLYKEEAMRKNMKKFICMFSLVTIFLTLSFTSYANNMLDDSYEKQIISVYSFDGSTIPMDIYYSEYNEKLEGEYAGNLTLKKGEMKEGFYLHIVYEGTLATVYKGNIIKNLIMDCQSYTKYRPNETTGGIFVSWRRKEELPTGA